MATSSLHGVVVSMCVVGGHKLSTCLHSVVVYMCVVGGHKLSTCLHGVVVSICVVGGHKLSTRCCCLYVCSWWPQALYTVLLSLRV